MTGPDYSEGSDWHTIMTTATRAELAAELLRVRGKYGKLRGDEYRTHQRWIEAETRLDALRAKLDRVVEFAIYIGDPRNYCNLCEHIPQGDDDLHDDDCPLKETNDVD